MIIELMHFYMMWLNSFAVESGLSEKYSLHELVSRHKLDAKLHCESPFGAYCEVHTDPDVTNTTDPRMRWGICLGPTGNIQGSYKFMLLSTRKKIKRRKFTEMPITESVIKQVSKWVSKDQGMSGLTFMDKYEIEYKFDEEEDAIMEERHVEEAPFPDILAEAPGILTQYKNLINGDDVIEDEPVLDDQE